MARYRKKPVVIEALQWTGQNWDELMAWLDQWHPDLDDDSCNMWTEPDGTLVIPTLEGDMQGSPGDWIIRGVQGEFYPCKPNIFEATYESAENAA